MDTLKKYWPLAAALLIMLTLGSIFAPDYLKKTRAVEDLTVTVEKMHTDNQTLKAENATLHERAERSEVSGAVKDHTVFPDGKVVDHTVTWRAKTESTVRDQVTQALEQARATASASASETNSHNQKDSSTTKRNSIDVGLGYSTTATWWPYLGARVLGPLGAFAGAELDPTKGTKVFQKGIGGVKVSF